MKKKTKYLFEIIDELFIYAQSLPAPELTFLAETLGKMCVGAPPSVKDKVVDLLNSLLEHQSPAVREGALYGLEHHINYLSFFTIKSIAEDDPSDGVRQVAKDLLKELETQMCVARKVMEGNRNALRELAK